MRVLVKISAAMLVVLISPISFALAQTPARKPAPVTVATIAPRPEDVGTLDGIIAAFYDVITGPAGQPRQWARDRTLYIPDVKFISVEYRQSTGKPFAQVMSHQQYVDSANEEMVRNGFFEREIHRVTQQFGSLAHVFSTYESGLKAGGPVMARGINSIELYYDGTRWWITAAQWEDETPGRPIPKAFLP